MLVIRFYDTKRQHVFQTNRFPNNEVQSKIRCASIVLTLCPDIGGFLIYEITGDDLLPMTRSTANRDMSKKLILYRGERSAMRLAFLHVGMKLEGKNTMNTSDIYSEAKPVDRIADLLDSIKLYLDPEKYTFNYAKVEQLLTEAKQTVEQTARA